MLSLDGGSAIGDGIGLRMGQGPEGQVNGGGVK